MLKADTAYSLILFFLAGICEVGGCYLIWAAMRGTQPLWLSISGGLLLIFYGVVASAQPAGFGRTYAAYSGLFVLLSLLWAWHVHGVKPDLWDTVGGAIVIFGTVVILFIPRK